MPSPPPRRDCWEGFGFERGGGGRETGFSFFSSCGRLGGKIELLTEKLKQAEPRGKALRQALRVFRLSPFTTSGAHLDALHDVVKRADARVDLGGVLCGRPFLDVEDMSIKTRCRRRCWCLSRRLVLARCGRDFH